MSVKDWLESDGDWLDADVEPPRTRVESGTKLPGEKKRGKRVQHGLGKKRVWATDGDYVWFRRKQANPATLERHERFIATGSYKHVGTQDDVEIYQLMPGSPFKRAAPVNFGEMRFYDARRWTAKAAVRRDWPAFVDGLEDLAGRIKGQYHDGVAKMVYNDMLSYLFNLIAMHGGPSREEIDREVAALRTRRGERRSSSLVLPAGIALR